MIQNLKKQLKLCFPNRVPGKFESSYVPNFETLSEPKHMTEVYRSRVCLRHILARCWRHGIELGTAKAPQCFLETSLVHSGGQVGSP